MLQYFNTSWSEITEKMPELAEAGYSSLWLPPPTKGSGGLSVGYDLWDPFDLGGKDQRGSVSTRYGTDAELRILIETAHRFGIRVYFDNIMNHRAFDIPGYNENTPIDIYPGMVPEDFHLRVTEDGFYRKWDNCRDWNSSWQVQNLGLADLIDIAHETPNDNFGLSEGDDHPKITFVRQPDNPAYYPDTDLPIHVGYGEYEWDVYTFANKEPFEDTGWTTNSVDYNGAGNGTFDWNDTDGDGQHDAGEASEPFTDTGLDPARPGWNTTNYGYGDGIYNMGNPVAEDVNAYLIRAVCWLMDHTKCDGLRLDAVKHVPSYFFGEYGSDTSDAGYCGGAQRQFNISRGFSDWDNHRDSVFSMAANRDDAMMFGEHLGEPPGYSEYISAGMRLVDNPLRTEFNSRLGNMWNGLNGFDQPGAGGFNPQTGVMHAQSHDNDYAARRELQHAFYFTREGLGLLYTDGNHHAETLGESGGAFPRHANTSFLGQWGDNRVPNLLYIHEQFCRGYQKPVWSDGDYVAYERLDWRQGGNNDEDKVCMLFMLNDNYADGQSRDIRESISFGHTPFDDDQYLYNYSTYGGGFYTYASALDSVIVPPGGYFVFSWKNPDPSTLWSCHGGNPIEIYENGREVDWMAYVRRDGPDGDPNFNPYGVEDTNDSDYAYTYPIPRISSGTNLRFVARVDGSAANVLIKLDGGMDLNGVNHPDGDPRDNPPALTNDVFLGYEQAGFVKRIHREKFAAADSSRNKIGSAGAETYSCTIGSSGFTTNESDGVNDWSDAETASWIWHAPSSQNDLGNTHFEPAPENASDSNITVWVKTGYQNDINKVFLYYTTNGVSWPEGAGGEGGNKATRVIELGFDHNEWDGGAGENADWWKGTIPALSDGCELRWKISCYRQQDGSGSAPWGVLWPGDADAVANKTTRMGVWEITNFNADTIVYRPHADYGSTATGLVEGFHFLQARAFLERNNGAAIYNTFKQTFYYDAVCPTGYIVWPQNDGDAVGGQEYGVVVRTDPSVVEVWYHIDDSNTNNDDTVTGTANGNGVGFEPYIDANGDGEYDPGESYTDLNSNGTWDIDYGESWAQAYPTTPSDMSTEFPRKWRFSYMNIPSGGSNATIKVRLREYSSVDRSAFTNTTDATGHYTTLERQVYTWGPDIRMFVAWPQMDGDTISSGYEMKTHFSKSLADGLSDQDLIDRFLVKIQSSASGRITGGVAQARSGYAINRDASGDYHEMVYVFSNLYNGDPDWLHGVEVTFDRDGLPDLYASRLVKASPAEVAPYIAVVEPPEYGPDGKRHEIVIPDVPSPSNEQRRTSIRVATGTNAASVWLTFDFSPSGYTNQGGGIGFVSLTNEGSTIFRDYLWTNLIAGTYRFTAWVATDSGATNTASRNAWVVKREWVNASTNDYDDDDDGLSDTDETTLTPLPNERLENPEPNPENWDNGEVHVHYAYGKSLPQSPDSDGDGLPDGLEVGWRTASGNTDTNTDTNGDGRPNFMPDLDPPFFNTLDNYNKVPGVNSQSEGGDRALQLYGSMTDPANADTDYDGIPDGIEDGNCNGWVDGDGAIIEPSWEPWSERDWPDGEMDDGETWAETDPNNSDTDDDGLSDGYGEDKDFNGWISGDVNSNRVYEAGEAWTETDPLNSDTDGDGLPDGWEVQYGLDPLDDGTNSFTNAASWVDGNVDNGPDGDPDSDTFDNETELANGTNPRHPDTGVPPPEGSIVIGRGAPLGTVNGQTNYQEFTDWTIGDLIALDEYNTGGSQAVDIYRAWDGFDSSRDIVAFYAHDGGDSDSGGDDMFYFRIDLHDLQAYAEENAVDLYVVIDMNSPDNGEGVLPDMVNTLTEMKWEAVVAVYGGNNGRIYIDTDHGNNSVSDTSDLSPFGVVMRDQNSANGFGEAYWNSDLDAVEFSVSRQALLDGGWNGLNAAQLNYQIISTKVGTGDDPQGPGDIGGRCDVRDTITDDWIASDYWRDQNNIIQNGKLYTYIGRSADNDCGKRAKVAMLVHGNQHIQPGSVIQDLINNGNGAGYHRLLDGHEVFEKPVNMHITPTLASAIQWARADTNISPAWRDGPAFNDRIRQLVQTNVIYLLAGSFSDHILPYFTADFNNDNAELARSFLRDIYGVSFASNSVFWPAERVVDADVFGKITNMGYGFTVIDQNTHMWNWFGRTTSLSDDGYRINRIHGVDCFIINNRAGEYRFQNNDQGLPMPLRELFNRRARSGTQDQVVTLLSNWEDFANNDQADAYDRNICWVANHPWIMTVAFEQIAGGEVDLDNDGNGDAWYMIDRGTPSISKQGHDWINHATQGSYDNWYVGSPQEAGLQGRIFEIRPGVPLPEAYGMLYFDGIVSSAWEQVQLIADSNIAALARGALHASVFETAFHEEDNNNLARFSTGDYIYPDTSSNSLIHFARYAQAQTRIAAMYNRLDDWVGTAPGITTPQVSAEDVDLDGENEYLLYNDRLFGVFERIGGRMVAAWVRDILDGNIFQVVGNPVGYAGSDTEEEGTTNASAEGDVQAFRTSCLKDWWVGTLQYVNDLYTATDWTNGWRLVSSDGKIQKTVTLAENSGWFEVAYEVGDDLTGQPLYIRQGLSPNLYDLLRRGQQTLGDLALDTGVASLANTNYRTTVEAFIGASDAGHNAGINTAAVDDNPGEGVEFYTLNMRNQAQTHQVELVGTNSFSFALGFRAYPSDWDGDGMPNVWLAQHGGTNALGDAANDPDGDGVLNWQEYIAGTSPTNGMDFLYTGTAGQPETGFELHFPTRSRRNYFIWYNDASLCSPSWMPATTNPISGTGSTNIWTDDGTLTDPDPALVTNRFYRIEVALPE